METTALSRAEWWEILFFIKKLEPKQQQEVNDLLLQNLDDQVRPWRISSALRKSPVEGGVMKFQHVISPSRRRRWMTRPS